MDNPAKTNDLIAHGYAFSVDSDAAAQTAVTAVLQVRLDAAWRALRREVPSIEWSITYGYLDEADLIDVICAAVQRVLDNPEGVEEESSAIDDYRESRKRANATSDLYFTSAELRRLAPPNLGTAGSMKYLGS